MGKTKIITKTIVTVYFVQLKLIMLAHAKTYFGQHPNLSIIAQINCVFIGDIGAVKHGSALDIQLKPVIGKLTLVLLKLPICFNWSLIDLIKDGHQLTVWSNR